MPGLIIACARDASRPIDQHRLRAGCARLTPSDARASQPLLWERAGMSVALVDPAPGARRVDGCVYVGMLATPSSDWWRVGSPRPDGLYALCRHDDAALEIVTDTVASHTVWYVKTEQLLLASTSQRALASLVGDFRLNHRAVSWMLSSGCLGPESSWDARFQRVPGDSVLRLDRRSWELSVQSRPVVFRAEPASHERQVERLRAALDESFAALDIDDSEWVVPLSGGGDSRGLLIFLLRGGHKPRCLTYGSAASLRDPSADALTARAVADALGIEQAYVPLEERDGDEATTLRRYAEAGEGRIDHIDAYTDGLRFWSRLQREGIRGVLRGDQAFGAWPVFSENHARISGGAVLVSDYSPSHQIRRLELADQTLPDGLRRGPEESTEGYRDRLYQQYRLPVIMAALNQIKTSYVDVVSPLLTRRIVDAVRAMPDELRTDKRAFHELVTQLGPSVPFARHDSTAPGDAYFARQGTLAALREALATPAADSVLGAGNVAAILAGLASTRKPSEPRRDLRRRVKTLLPRPLARIAVDARGAPPLSAYRLAFRAYLAATIAAVLAQDAAGVR